MPQIIFSRGHIPLFRIQLQSQSLKIGRSGNCDVILSEPEISREHAALYVVQGQYLLKKIGKGEVWLRGKPVENHVLQDGETFLLGTWEVEFQQESGGERTEGETLGTVTKKTETQAIAGNFHGILVEAFCLRVIQPSRTPRDFSLKTGSLMVGADSKNDVVIEDPFVSARHLKLSRHPDGIWVHDLGSTNGTYINGMKIRESRWEAGAEIKIGDCRLVLLQEQSFETAKPIPVDRYHHLIGASPAMQELYGFLERIGSTEATTLVLGESGCGKELVARALHRISNRRAGPFVALNCGAISRELIESELFGHEKGAFTGAQRRHEGAFGLASGGTLFLDEIGELPLELQPKLLRVLEDKTYRRVGGMEEIAADVRVVAATHRDLSDLVKTGKFREDLFFRLFVLPIQVPPLRARLEDLQLLVEDFLKEFSPPGSAKKITPLAMEKLKSHRFPGNVRELRNVLLRGVVLAQGEEIDEQDIRYPENFSENPDKWEPMGLEKLEELEKRMVLKALNTHEGNKSKAAEALGIAKSTLFAKIKLYGLEEKR